MPTSSNVILGGPAYNLEVDARHCQSIVILAAAIGHRLLRIDYRHGSLEIARNGLFSKALADPEAEYLLWLDSHCWLEQGWGEVAAWPGLLAKNGWPMIGAVAPQRDGETGNVLLTSAMDRHDGPVEISSEVKPCFAVGTGLVCFRLAWYRAHWPATPWFRTEWRRNPDSNLMQMLGEDFWHCAQLPIFHETARYSSCAVVRHRDGART